MRHEGSSVLAAVPSCAVTNTDSLFEGQGQLLQPLLLPGNGAGDPILQLGQLLEFLLVQPVVVLGRRDQHTLELPAQTPLSLGPL